MQMVGPHHKLTCDVDYYIIVQYPMSEFSYSLLTKVCSAHSMFAVQGFEYAGAIGACILYTRWNIETCPKGHAWSLKEVDL